MNRKFIRILVKNEFRNGFSVDVDDDKEFKYFCDRIRGYMQHPGYYNDLLTVRIDREGSKPETLLQKIGRIIFG
ncbi:hypothetical protein OAB75_00785 [Amylibacter sp.]|nr:hypothetical protein [Amylibacter sp.]